MAMENKEFYLDCDGRRVHCKLDCPPSLRTGADACPLLILLHGFTGHMEEPHIAGIAAHSVSLGFAVLRVDLYGHGGSDGEFKRHSVLRWVDQMLAVVDYAAALPFVSGLYLAGHSQGGLTAILVAALERDRIRALIPLAPATVIHYGANEGCLLGMTFDPVHIPDELAVPGPGTQDSGLTVSGNYLRTAQLLPVEEAIRRYGGPVLIVHADTDEAVPVRYAEDAARLYRDCTLTVIRGDTHCFDRHLDEVKAAVGEFLMAHR